MRVVGKCFYPRQKCYQIMAMACDNCVAAWFTSMPLFPWHGCCSPPTSACAVWIWRPAVSQRHWHARKCFTDTAVDPYIRGCTSGGVYVPCLYLRASWELRQLGSLLWCLCDGLSSTNSPLHVESRLCIVAVFYVWCFEPHTCVIEGWFSALKAHLLLLLLPVICHSSSRWGAVRVGGHAVGHLHPCASWGGGGGRGGGSGGGRTGQGGGAGADAHLFSSQREQGQKLRAYEARLKRKR